MIQACIAKNSPNRTTQMAITEGDSQKTPELDKREMAVVSKWAAQISMIVGLETGKNQYTI